jgi:hypothetical protein
MNARSIEVRFTTRGHCIGTFLTPPCPEAYEVHLVEFLGQYFPGLKVTTGQ